MRSTVAKVLIVDDETNIREVVGLYLRRDGYEVVSTADALELVAIEEKVVLGVRSTRLRRGRWHVAGRPDRTGLSPARRYHRPSRRVRAMQRCADRRRCRRPGRVAVTISFGRRFASGSLLTAARGRRQLGEKVGTKLIGITNRARTDPK